MRARTKKIATIVIIILAIAVLCYIMSGKLPVSLAPLGDVVTSVGGGGGGTLA